MIALTDNAVDAVRRVLEDSEDGVAGLRISVETGGCSGYLYKLGLESEPLDGDAVVDFAGVKVFVDSDSWPLLDGAEVDFVEDVSGTGFVFNNPNAKAKCGCGKSFC
ncbi:HesB/IscA family protein [Telmatospirillum siberiense]|uniref:Iron-sulfur cluster assembly accessory protein n=1 Tax=Telmatospirillum siberiense TaxID=382514 RepID=A0A2N3PNB6_9PROT|nr:iron-sulfur cluster assembly accessory protein [Telmatospirillum siberiense]PKU21898.1 iron-sulfur cluster assembly accessory protein [Telmatospirillum siberiense]